MQSSENAPTSGNDGEQQIVEAAFHYEQHAEMHYESTDSIVVGRKTMEYGLMEVITITLLRDSIVVGGKTMEYGLMEVITIMLKEMF